jgi:NarL family two-component system sensor histidine kinase YdfH
MLQAKKSCFREVFLIHSTRSIPVRSDIVRQVNGKILSLRYNTLAMKKPSLFARVFNDERNYERPFFLFLTLVMAGMYVWALLGSPSLDTAWKVALFTVLMIGHIVLYWLSELVLRNRRWLALYLLAQSLIAFSLGMMAQVVGIIFGLYPGLIGLIIGVPMLRVYKMLVIGYILGLSALNFVLMTGTSSLLWWTLVIIPVVIFTSIYVSLYLRQADARQQAQSLLRELEVANRRLSEYAARVEDLTITAERQRMARELHDTLSQGLAGLILQLEAADAHLAGGRPGRGRAILQQSMEKARGTLADARKAIDDLRRAAPQGLEDALLHEVDHFTDATGIPCTHAIEIPADLSARVVETAIRAVSEGLTNIARHAKAKNITLRVTGINKELEIELCDDGIGFDPEAVDAGHYGLLGMRERVRLAGGSFDVDSHPGEGTHLVIRFPLENAPDE